ncbi:RNA recognition motif domain-containing protein [Ditylenchus destructor]|uniref:RNA recognition motif domain-containing protein n=1 Tax=Ditylenchus destructor TaxID=166010 RepID=A0AAD4NFJ7_9BILA|nr:RNA recognition motif domain-containing protein [Ditylenchus destructor]
MSRLIVKGLPKNSTEAKVREIFGKFGTVTDVSLKYSDDGVFRRFGFVGFESEEYAHNAMEQLNNTVIQSSKIIVEQCRPLKEGRVTPAYGKMANAERSEANQTTQEGDNDSPRCKRKKPEATVGETISVEKMIVNDPKIDHFMREYDGDKKLSLIFRGPPNLKKKNFTEWLSPVRINSLKLMRTKSEIVIIVSFNRPLDVRQVLQRDGSFLGGSRISIAKFPSPDNASKRTTKTSFQEQDREKTIHNIRKTGRIFVRNLAYVCNEDNLRDLFETHGELEDLQCVVDRKTDLCKGFAVVTFTKSEDAVTAYEKLDGTIFMGRVLHLLPGEEKPKNDSGLQTQEKRLSQFQKDRAKDLKKEAHGKSHTWNPLFMGANAAAEALAKKMDVEKRDIVVEDGANSIGVRLAMAETKLVKETKEFLLANGICIDDTFTGKRSATIIIVKNLPASSVTEEQLQKRFKRFGKIKRFVMPPADGLCAIVEMSSKSEAKKAFEGIAYSSLSKGGQPLYLEWAPVSDEEPKDTEEIKLELKPEEDVLAVLNNKYGYNEEKEEKKGEENEEENKPSKLLVRNVPFQASLEEMTQLFSAFGELKDIRMPRKPGNTSHRGFCFVEFVAAADAARSYDTLFLSTHLYGRRLVLEWAKTDDSVDQLREKSASKLKTGKGTRKRKNKKEIRDAIENNDSD